VQHGIAESFFATLKKELMYRHVWPTRRPLVQPSSRSLQGSYNRVRLHSTLNYSSPTSTRRTIIVSPHLPDRPYQIRPRKRGNTTMTRESPKRRAPVRWPSLT